MIFKLQQGGAVPPLVSYQPVTLGQSTSNTTAAKKNNESDLTDKDLLEILNKLDGLPSDME